MTRHLITCLFGVALFTCFISCQKELSTEFGAPATGSLQSSAGDCLPKITEGSYIVNKVLTDSNYIEVSVNVLTAGPYTIVTDSLNGYFFKATGTFTTAGTNTVRLRSTGKPLAQGIDNFTVFFDSSSCDIAVTVLPAGTTIGPAAFTMNCTSFTPAGNYYKDTTLTAANTVAVQVNVVAPGGTYTITTNTVNGYSFSKSGTFSSGGTQTVTLQATGKPLATGTNNFIATGGTANCNFQVNVNTPPAGGCTTPTLQGTYTSGTALTAANKVVFTHTYTTTGNFTVSTNTVNGYGFSSSSVAGTAGTQVTITLTGTGSPTTAGTNNFTVMFGDGTTCPFSVTVSPSAPVVNNDHFPLTANSWWSYDEVGNPDSIVVTNLGTGSFNGNMYRLFQYKDDFGPFDSLYYRRNANDYYEYRDADFYSSFYFDAPQKVDILFLKEGTTTGATWTSATYTGIVTEAGVAFNVSEKYNFTCNDANATTTVNGKTYTNVYKITLQPQISINGSPFQNDFYAFTMYYAKGVGLIDLIATDGTISYELKIKNYRVF